MCLVCVLSVCVPSVCAVFATIRSRCRTDCDDVVNAVLCSAVPCCGVPCRAVRWRGVLCCAVVLRCARTGTCEGMNGLFPRYTSITGNFVHEIGHIQKQSSFYFQAETAQVGWLVV